MTNINFESMEISKLGEMAKYYSSHSVDSINRMVRMNSRLSLVSAIKYSSKFMAEQRKGVFTFNDNTNTTNTADANIKSASAATEYADAIIRGESPEVTQALLKKVFGY